MGFDLSQRVMLGAEAFRLKFGESLMDWAIWGEPDRYGRRPLEGFRPAVAPVAEPEPAPEANLTLRVRVEGGPVLWEAA